MQSISDLSRPTRVSSPLETCRGMDRMEPNLAGLARGVAERILSMRNARPNAVAPWVTPRYLGVLMNFWVDVLGRRGQRICAWTDLPRGAVPVSDRGILDDVACASGTIEPVDAAGQRQRVTDIQYCLERELTRRLNMDATSSVRPRVSVVVHTPQVCTPLRVRPGDPVPGSLISPAAANRPMVAESIARRVVSIRALSTAGARVFAYYPQTAHAAMTPEQVSAYAEACTRDGVFDRPVAIEKNLFESQSGATYVVGDDDEPYQCMVAFRLRQANAIRTEDLPRAPGELTVQVATRGDQLFDRSIEELRPLGIEFATLH